ncbi:MAG: AAA family ATPase, partial [Actinomycetota bacterium]
SADPVPSHLRDSSYPGAAKLGHGKGYRYPHEAPGHWVEQEYRPVRFEGTRYYVSSGMGEEDRDWEPGAGPSQDDGATR